MAVTFYTNMFNYAGFSAAAEPSITVQGYACSGAETTGPAYDLVDGRRTNVITIDTNGETGAFTVDMDMTSVPGAGSTFGIIDNHNFNTAAAEIKFTYGGATTTITTAYEGALGSALAASTVTSNVVQEPADGILLATWSALQVQNYEVSIEDDGSGNFSADVTMGEWIIGLAITTSTGPELRSNERYMYQGINVLETDGGQKFGFSKHTSPQRQWQLKWIHLTANDKSNLEYVFNVTRGRKYPFYIDFGLDATPRLYLVRFMQDDLPFVKVTEGSYGLTINVEEEI